MPGGYSYVCLPSRGRRGEPLIRLCGVELDGGKLTGMSGSHRADGLFAIAGEGVRAGRTPGVRIADMAPTILSLCEVPVPAGWDGRAPAGIPRALRASTSPRWEGATETAYDPQDEAEIAERLEQLGYLG